MAYSATASVYEHFPFPSSNVDNADVHVPDDIPAVVGMARAYPNVSFVDLEPNGPSREVAERLRAQAGVENLKFVDGGISGESLGTKFDFIYSYGVVHHIPDPGEAMRWLSEHLAENSLLHLLDDPLLRESVASLSPLQRASLIELAVSASGFNLIAGRGTALSWCTRRIEGNLLTS